jgi:hypothetical protein
VLRTEDGQNMDEEHDAKVREEHADDILHSPAISPMEDDVIVTIEVEKYHDAECHGHRSRPRIKFLAQENGVRRWLIEGDNCGSKSCVEQQCTDTELIGPGGYISGKNAV